MPSSHGLQEPLPPRAAGLRPARAGVQVCVSWRLRNGIQAESFCKDPPALPLSGAGAAVIPALPGAWLTRPPRLRGAPARGRGGWRGSEEWQAGHLGAAGRPRPRNSRGHPARFSHSAVPLRKDNGAQLLGINNSGAARDIQPGPREQQPRYLGSSSCAPGSVCAPTSYPDVNLERKRQTPVPGREAVRWAQRGLLPPAPASEDPAFLFSLLQTAISAGVRSTTFTQPVLSHRGLAAPWTADHRRLLSWKRRTP